MQMNNFKFDSSKPVPNLTDEELNHFISYVTALTPKQIESFRSIVSDDIDAYKNSAEWDDIDTVINTQPLEDIHLRIKDIKDELCRMLISEASWQKRYDEEKPFFHSMSFEHLPFAIVWKAKEDTDTYYRNKLRNKARKEAQGKVPFDQLKYIKNLNPQTLYEDPGFPQQYRDKLKAKIGSVITKYLDVLLRTVQHEEHTMEDCRQIDLLGGIMYFIHKGYDIRSVEGLYFLAEVYCHTNGIRRNDMYALLLAMKVLSPVPEVQEEQLTDFISVKDENFYLAFDTKSYAANNTPYSDECDDLIQKDGQSDSQHKDAIGQQIHTEYNDFAKNQEYSTILTRAINRLAIRKNKFNKQPEKFSDAWNKVYAFVACKIDGAYKRIYQTTPDEIENAPWCYYEALSDREESDRLIEPYDSELLDSFSQQFNKTIGKYRSLIYKSTYILNYIKVMQGYSKTVIKDFDSSKEDEDKTVEAVIKFLEPILNNDVINPRAFSVDGFIGLMKSILKDKLFNKQLSKNIRKSYSDDGINFNLPFLYQILTTIVFFPREDKYEKLRPNTVGANKEHILTCEDAAELNWLLVEKVHKSRTVKNNDSWRKKLVPLKDVMQHQIVREKIEEIHKKDPFVLR